VYVCVDYIVLIIVIIVITNKIGVCKTTWLKDPVRTGTLYVPASFTLSILYIGIIYELPFLNINPIIGLILGFPGIFIATKKLTEEFLFKNPEVATGKLCMFCVCMYVCMYLCVCMCVCVYVVLIIKIFYTHNIS